MIIQNFKKSDFPVAFYRVCVTNFYGSLCLSKGSSILINQLKNVPVYTNSWKNVGYQNFSTFLGLSQRRIRGKIKNWAMNLKKELKNNYNNCKLDHIILPLSGNICYFVS